MEYASGKKNIVIAGGAGFIGSHLCAELLKRGNNIICIDNYKTSSVEHIQSFLQFPNFEFIRQDITNPFDLATMRELEKFQIRIQGVQEIYHLATPCTPHDYTNYPWEVMLAGSVGTMNLINLAEMFNAKLLFTSSPVVYGIADTQKLIPETYWGYTDLFGYNSAYSESKRFSETACYWASKKRGIHTKIARVHNVYGPRMSINTGRPLAEIIGKALLGKPIMLKNQDEHIALLYIDDCVDALVKMMESDEQGPLNIGSDVPYLIADIAKLVIQYAESKSKIQAQETPAGAHPQLLLNVAKAKEKLGWIPIIKVEQGLKKTIDELKATHIEEFGALMRPLVEDHA